MRPNILIIVPAFNESGNVGKSVNEILSHSYRPTVLVVDDGSKDSTALEAAQAGAHVVSLPFNLGIGGAVQTGFQYAYRYNFDIAVQMDGDGQHDVSFLGPLVDPLLKNEAEMAIGSRFLAHEGYQSSFSRRIGIRFFSRLIAFLTGTKVTDPTSGFRAFNKRMIRIFAESYPHDFPEPEAVVMATQHKARIVEVPVAMRRREAGESSIHSFKSLYYMLKVTCAILLNRLRNRRVE